MTIEVFNFSINVEDQLEGKNTKQNEVKKPIKIEENKPKNTYIPDNWFLSNWFLD